MNLKLNNPKLLFSLFLTLIIVGAAAGFLPSSSTPQTAQLVGDIPAARVATQNGEVIDCGNVPIVSDSTNNGIGILVRNMSNVTVRNCNVSGFWVGLFAENAPGLTVVDSDFVDNATLSIFDVYTPASQADIANPYRPKFFYWPTGSPAPIKDGNEYRTPFTANNAYVVKDDLTGVTDQQFLMIPIDAWSSVPYSLVHYVYSGQINKLRIPYSSLPAAHIPNTPSNIIRGGGGIVVQNSSNVSIRNIISHRNFSGIELYNVSGATVDDNNLQGNFGFGSFLYNVDNSTIQNNDMRGTGYPARWRQMDGTDNAALMMMHDSDNNIILSNNLSYSPDGLFLSNAESPDGGWSELTSDNNTFRNNTAEYVPHNAFEVVFSHNNIFENNTASHSKIGFWITYGSGHRLINNTIDGNMQYGIALRQVNNYTITGNTISNSGRINNDPDGIGIFMTTDASHNWKTVFPENTNLTITGNTISNNERGLIIDGTFHDVTINNTYSGNDFDIIEGGNYFPGINVSINGVRVASRTGQCETLAAGAVPHPYVITFIGGGNFPDKSVLRNGFIPSCTGPIGSLNPANSFPNVTRAANLPNLGIFSVSPPSENKNNFSIKFARTAENDFVTGCNSSGQNCDKTAIKNRATSICPDTNMVILFQNNATFGWTTDNGSSPFASGNIPLISIGVADSPDRLTNETWGVCAHEFAHAFAYLADEQSGNLTLAQTGYEANRASIANCALPSECASKFGSSTCIAGCGFSNSLSRPRGRSILNGIDLNIPDSLTFNLPSQNRFASLFSNDFFRTGVDSYAPAVIPLGSFAIKNGSASSVIFPASFHIYIEPERFELSLSDWSGNLYLQDSISNNIVSSFSSSDIGTNHDNSFYADKIYNFTLRTDMALGGIAPGATKNLELFARVPNYLQPLFRDPSIFTIRQVNYATQNTTGGGSNSNSWTGSVRLTPSNR